MAIVSVLKDGNWIKSGEIKMSEVERVLAELEGQDLNGADEVIREAAELVEKTVEKECNFDRTTVINRTKQLLESNNEKDTIKALRKEFDLPYVKARYFVVNIDKVGVKKERQVKNPEIDDRIVDLLKDGTNDIGAIVKVVQNEFGLEYAAARYRVIKKAPK